MTALWERQSRRWLEWMLGPSCGGARAAGAEMERRGGEEAREHTVLQEQVEPRCCKYGSTYAWTLFACATAGAGPWACMHACMRAYVWRGEDGERGSVEIKCRALALMDGVCQKNT